MRRIYCWLALGAVAASSLGCRDDPALAPYSVVLPPAAEYVAHLPSDNAFDYYATAAQQIQETSTDDLFRTSFARAKRRELLAENSASLDLLLQAVEVPCEFLFRHQPPFEERANHRGWRLAGRMLTWKIEQAVAEEDWDEAVAWTIATVHFGLQLTGGDLVDSTLGWSIADRGRIAIASDLYRIPSDNLYSLQDGVDAALKARPSEISSLDHEMESMLSAIQALQDAHRQGDFSAIRDHLGSQSRSVNTFQRLRGEEREDFIEGMMAETRDRIEHHQQEITLAASQRQPFRPASDDRPWAQLSRQFLETVEPYIAVRDRALARTRLLAANAYVQARLNDEGIEPGALDGLVGPEVVDPYTGDRLRYMAAGTDSFVYSVGSNWLDDGGDSDRLGVSPDLRLEAPGL
ncbi:MAG: hypothetical protein IH944_09165 [Armatimonadetes bacterium]|nr:hypothetical protein [Armatimonadota bacterium]